MTVGALGRVGTWNRETLERRAIRRKLQVPSTAEVAFATERPLLAVAADGGIVSLANPLTGEQFGGVRLKADVTAIALSDDGARLIVGTSAGQVRFWDTAQRRQVGLAAGGHDGPVVAADVSSDGARVVTGGNDGRVRLWDATTGRELGELDIRAGIDSGSVGFVRFAPDGNILATGGSNGAIRLWDPLTGRELGPLDAGHNTTVLDGAFSPDGRVLATVSGDRMLRLWDVHALHQIGDAVHGQHSRRGGLHTVAFSSDGDFLATAGMGGEVQVGKLKPAASNDAVIDRPGPVTGSPSRLTDRGWPRPGRTGGSACGTWTSA